MTKQDTKLINELFDTLLLIKTREEMAKFMKDLCTPKELSDLSERWHVCKMLAEGKLSYREISQETGVSLATITRIARFLKDEPHQGYRSMLDKIKKTNRRDKNET